MTENKKTYRIFLSSPGDVNLERSIVRDEVKNMFEESILSQQMKCEIISWDEPDSPSPLLANQTPQATLRRQIVEPANCDLIIVIFWARMGTPLPKGEFTKENGEPYYSGTEWEYENALHSPTNPNILLYRRVDPIQLDPESAQYDNSLKQQSLVNNFFNRFEMADGSLTGLFQKYRGDSEFRKKLRDDLRGVLQLGLAEGTANSKKMRSIKHKPLWKSNPYVGLESYGEKHADVFFGREQEIERLEEKVLNNASCIAVVGSSGSGKSSLVMAGLVPQLKKSTDSSNKLFHCEVTKPSATDFLGEFSDAKTQLEINLVIDTLLEKLPNTTRLIMVVDQSEELLKLDNVAILHFISILNFIIQSPRVSLILTCRTDLYDDFIEVCERELQSYLQESTFMISAPRTDRMIDIIRKPAKAAGIVVEDVVVGKILETFEGNGDSLPLVSFLLGKLYETMGENKVFDLQAYEAAGEVDGVVKSSAEKTYTSLLPKESAKFADVFSRLLSIDSSNRVTREHCPLSFFQQNREMESVIDAFVKARLLTITKDNSDISSVEIAHESLIHNWPSLASLAQERASQIKWRQKFRSAAQRWMDSDKIDSSLIQGDELSTAIRLSSEKEIKFDAVEQVFFETSKARRLSIEKRIRLLGMLPLGTIFLSVLSFIFLSMIMVSLLVNTINLQKQQAGSALVTNFGFILNPLLNKDNMAEVGAIVDAFFDSGEYQSIRIVNANGDEIFSRTNAYNSDGSYFWLHDYIPGMASTKATAVLTNGWSQNGEISITLSQRETQQELTKSLKRLGIALVLLLFILLPLYVFSLKALRRLRERVS